MGLREHLSWNIPIPTFVVSNVKRRRIVELSHGLCEARRICSDPSRCGGFTGARLGPSCGARLRILQIRARRAINTDAHVPMPRTRLCSRMLVEAVHGRERVRVMHAVVAQARKPSAPAFEPM
eukprot:6195476-Pleurochrysis_carterae.AAC.1